MIDVSRSGGLLPLRCATSRPRPDVCVVHLAGELDMATVPVVVRYLRQQAADRPAELVLDLGAVTLLAAAGVALLVDVHHDDLGLGGRLHLVGVAGNRAVDRMLRITGLRFVFEVHDDLQALLDALPPR
jgi:anti-sigma B factor antagonist